MSLEVRARATREFVEKPRTRIQLQLGQADGASSGSRQVRQAAGTGSSGRQVKQCTQRYSVSGKRICPEHFMLVCATTACHSDLQPTLHILRALVDRPQGKGRSRDVSIMKIMCDKPQSGRF